MNGNSMKVMSPSLAALLVAMVGAGCSATTDDGLSESAVTSSTSAYSDLGPLDQHCRVIEKASDDEPYWGRFDCGGMGGYSLTAESGDGRENVVVTTPDGSEHDLEVWARYPGFGHLGPKAEWRGTFVAPGQVKPSALIFRYFAQDENGRDKSYLLVARLTNDAACVYAAVDGTTAGANKEARIEADKAATMRCPSEVPSGQVTSVYTPLDTSEQEPYPECKKSCSTGDMPLCEFDCGGIGEYSAIASEGDWTSLNVRYHAGEYFVPAASLVGHLGPKAEWRGIGVAPGKVDPFALIYRYIQQDTVAPPRYQHSLVVVKLTPNQAPCLFVIINASTEANANVLARQAAEQSRTQACPATPPELPPVSLDD